MCSYTDDVCCCRTPLRACQTPSLAFRNTTKLCATQGGALNIFMELQPPHICHAVSRGAQGVHCAGTLHLSCQFWNAQCGGFWLWQQRAPLRRRRGAGAKLPAIRSKTTFKKHLVRQTTAGRGRVSARRGAGAELSALQLEVLGAAAGRARAELGAELGGCWGDALPLLAAAEWGAGRAALLTPRPQSTATAVQAWMQARPLSERLLNPKSTKAWMQARGSWGRLAPGPGGAKQRDGAGMLACSLRGGPPAPSAGRLERQRGR